MYEMLKELIKPELICLIPVLYLIGTAFKKSSVPDNKIPYLLGLISIVLTMLWLISTTAVGSLQTACIMIFTGITQGILIAGASVYINQLIKQGSK